MGSVLLALPPILALAAVILFYAAYPYRGARSPVDPRLGELMRRGVLSLPTVDPAERDQVHSQR